MQGPQPLTLTAAAIKHHVTTEKRHTGEDMSSRSISRVRRKTDVGPRETVKAVESDEDSQTRQTD